MGDDDVKRLILARRARFVAAAVAGLNAAMCGGSTEPQACLSIAAEGGADAPPQVCLSPPYNPPDGGDAGDAGDASDDGDAAPQPCLSPIPDGGDGG